MKQKIILLLSATLLCSFRLGGRKSGGGGVTNC